MQNATLWRALVEVDKTVVEDLEYDENDQVLVVYVRPKQQGSRRCGRCRRRRRGYDRGEGRRRWRTLDLGTIAVWLEADGARHGITVQAVPWGRHGAGHTLAFDDQVARWSRSARRPQLLS